MPVGRISSCNQYITDEAIAANSLDGRAAEKTSEGGIVEGQQEGDGRLLQILARLQLHFGGARRKLVPRTGGKTVVAAIDAIADHRPEFVRDRPLVLNGEIGDAAARIQLVGSGEGCRGAGVEAGAAGAAMILLGLIETQLGRGEHAAQKQPGAMAAADEIGMFALPAETGRGGKRLFHYRGSVDEDLHILTGAGSKARGDLLQPPLDDVMVIAVAGIDRNGCLVRFQKQVARVFLRAVIETEHDDGAHITPERFGFRPTRLGFLHPRHGAVVAIVEELPQPLRCKRNAVGYRDATEIEAERNRLPTNEIRQFARAYPLLVVGNVDRLTSRDLLCGIYKLRRRPQQITGRPDLRNPDRRSARRGQDAGCVR
ncbi:hypothetical protein AT6N2_C2270 [Agrobacterium tumefaciens]|nr:hypothetical protein AT6N2_C2270 [Agrobacterium tumefaciens]